MNPLYVSPGVGVVAREAHSMTDAGLRTAFRAWMLDRATDAEWLQMLEVLLKDRLDGAAGHRRFRNPAAEDEMHDALMYVSAAARNHETWLESERLKHSGGGK